ncbi:MAG TPA: DUF1631 family protein [Arenimonas sp.]|nr:DUF1631 family protein [Arenimonas sp.]HPW33361.1 DUF1631 family protein [Arenimonas sp.]
MSQNEFHVTGQRSYQNDPELFNTLRKHTISHLTMVLGRVLGKADDWLFDLAQKEEVLIGSPHMDSMRKLRMARTPLENGFKRHFDSGFESMRRGVQQESNVGRVMSLVADDELEVQLASEFVVEAVVNAHGPALNVIAQRFAAIVGVQQLETSLNPLSAANLANSIYVAQRDVQLPPSVRVVLYKYFERELVQSLGSLLTELNARMSAAGIRADLGNPRPVDAAPEPAPAPVAQRATQGSTDDKQMFDALCSMLHAFRPQMGGGNGNAGNAGGSGGGFAASGNAHAGAGFSAAQSFSGAGTHSNERPMAMEEMVSVLSLLQRQVPQAVQAAMMDPKVSLAHDLKKEMLRSAKNIGLPSDQIRLSQDDEDAVDLVGMLFDVLFDERDFEQLARGLMSRLVVPYVKAAVIDRRMFMNKGHPARRLLNSLAEAVEGNKGEGPQERELLQKAENTVDTLVAEFNEDMAIFETLEQELRSFLDQHRRRMELAERRATEAQRGQERLEQARTLASAELAKRVTGLNLPPALDDFFSRCWAHHLSMIALREGPDSQPWNAALGVADALLELLPNSEHPNRRAIAPSMINMREPLETVLASSGITGESAQQTIRSLQVSMESMAPQPATVKIAAVPAADERKPLLSVVSNKDALDYNVEDIPVLRNLAVGMWVHLAADDDKLHPAKLSWISPISSRLMFVNRRGVRVLVASLEELAAMKKQGKLVVREQENLFDQAMQSVMGRLKTEAS